MFHDLTKSSGAEPSRSEQNAGQDIVVRLRSDITNNVFAPEAKLKFADLTKRYDLGVGTIREALSQLISEGFVTLEAGKGFRVAPVSRAELIEVTEHFLNFERQAIAEAIRLGDDDWESRIVSAHHRLNIIESLPWAQRMERHGEWVQRHREFHASLVSACQQRWLLRLRAMMFDQLDRYRFLTKMAAEGQGTGRADEHRQIMEATLARDTPRAVALIENHIRATTEAGLSKF